MQPPLIRPSYQKKLDRYSTLAIEASGLLEGIYWTKNHHFTGAKAFYSDPIADYYWTLVEQFEIADQKEFITLEQDVRDFFEHLDKEYAFYLTPYDRERDVHNWLTDLKYEVAFRDSFMFLKDPQELQIETVPDNYTLHEVNTEQENEQYIHAYTFAYTSNPNDAYYDFGAEGVYESIYRETWRNPQLRKKFRKFMVLHDQKPVSCGAIYFRDGLGYLAEVGTGMPYRQKGLARIISAACINAARQEGCSTIVLATEENSIAAKLYGSLGFETKTTFWGMVRSR
jgi:ribosomal protein S18 acetylase RimI-like enzyme